LKSLCLLLQRLEMFRPDRLDAFDEALRLVRGRRKRRLPDAPHLDIEHLGTCREAKRGPSEDHAGNDHPADICGQKLHGICRIRFRHAHAGGDYRIVIVGSWVCHLPAFIMASLSAY